MAYVGNQPADTAIRLDDGSVTSAKLANDSVTAAKILDGTIVADDLNTGIITNAKINASAAIAASKLAISGGTNITLQSDGTFDLDNTINLTGGLNIGGTVVIDSSRNITNASINANLLTGIVPIDRIGTGTKNSTTFLRGDNTFATISTGSLNSLSDDPNPKLSGTLNVNNRLIQFGDSYGSTANRLQLGASQDMLLYHDGTHSYLTHTNSITSSLIIQNLNTDTNSTDGIRIETIDDSSLKHYVHLTNNAGVRLGVSGIDRISCLTSGTFFMHDIILNGSSHTLKFRSGLYYTILDGLVSDSQDNTITIPAVTGTAITTANSDTPATTTEVSNADHVLINDGGTLKKISRFNLGIGSVNADNISQGADAVTITTTSGNITLDAQAQYSNIIFKGTVGSTDTEFARFDSGMGLFTFKNNTRIAYQGTFGKYINLEFDNPTSTTNLIVPNKNGTLITTGNSDAPSTTTSSGDADFVLIDDGGTMKKITPTNLGIGSSVFTNLDISGDIDVDGTTNLDVVDIDGAVNMSNVSTDYYSTSFQINNTNADFSGALLDMRASSGSINTVNGRFLRFYTDNGSTERFHVKGSGEIYTASGILLGGTGSANKLDDYEEGTWTPVINGRSFGFSTGSYTKVGRLVTVYYDCNTMSGGNITNPDLHGLPFTASNSMTGNYGGYMMIHEPAGINVSSGFTYVYFRVIKNTGTAQMLQGGGTGSTVSHNGGVVMSNGNNFRGMGQYYTDA